jgi:hypothetical protein
VARIAERLELIEIEEPIPPVARMAVFVINHAGSNE